MALSAGSLNKPAILEVKAEVADNIGGAEEKYVTAIDPYWVQIKPLRGTQAFEVGQRFSAVTHMVTGRYVDGISAATHRIRWGTRILRIEVMTNIDEKSEEIEFLCEESPAIPEQQK